MAISKEQLEKILSESFPNAVIKLTDLVGDQDHYLLEIEDAAFVNVSLIDQHRMVKGALASILDTKLHAITIKTKPLK